MINADSMSYVRRLWSSSSSSCIFSRLGSVDWRQTRQVANCKYCKHISLIYSDIRQHCWFLLHHVTSDVGWYLWTVTSKLLSYLLAGSSVCLSVVLYSSYSRLLYRFVMCSHCFMFLWPAVGVVIRNWQCSTATVMCCSGCCANLLHQQYVSALSC